MVSTDCERLIRKLRTYRISARRRHFSVHFHVAFSGEQPASWYRLNAPFIESGRDMPCVNMNLENRPNAANLQGKCKVCKRDSIPGGMHERMTILTCSVVCKDHNANRNTTKHVDGLDSRFDWLRKKRLLLAFDEVFGFEPSRGFGSVSDSPLVQIFDHHHKKPKGGSE